MKFKILYDNYAESGFEAAWGFSCLVEAHGKKLLFDVGWDYAILSRNMSKLSVEPKTIDSVFISHNHWDHMGALPEFLRVRGVIPVYVPKSISPRMKGELGKRAELVEIADACEIGSGFYSTGELGSDIKEQSLLVEGPRGNVLVTGCAHPGLTDMFSAASEFGRLSGIIGGLHDSSEFRILRELEIIAPCHCTQRKEEVLRFYPRTAKLCGAGSVIEV